jgi:hypothetical protein
MIFSFLFILGKFEIVDSLNWLTNYLPVSFMEDVWWNIKIKGKWNSTKYFPKMINEFLSVESINNLSNE